MDWDGVGTFALFISSGAVGVGIILLKAYRLRLEARLEERRMRQLNSPMPSDEVGEQLEALSAEVQRLNERLDFTERLLGGVDEKVEKPSASR